MIAYFDQNSSGTIGEAEFVQDPLLRESLLLQNCVSWVAHPLKVLVMIRSSTV